MNTTPLTPPPADVVPPPPPGQRPRAGWITPVLVVVGVLALLIAVGGAVIVGVRMLSTGQSVENAPTAGVTALDVRAASGEFTLAYGAVDEATLEVEGSGGWSLTRAGDTLQVRPPSRWFDWWFWNGDERVVLTLPEQLRGAGLDADLELSAGSLRAEGDFSDLRLEVNAGTARVDGSAQRADVRVNAGRADIGLSDVTRVDFDLNAGRIEAALRGAAPDDVTIDVSAGQIVLAVPDASYAVTSNVSAGSFDNQVEVASASPRSIDVRVSAGSATVRASE